MARIRDLEQERRRLEDGRPCPLCGATYHPYARGNVPDLEEAEATLKKARDEWTDVSGELGRLEGEAVKAAAEIGHAEKEIREKGATREADEKTYAGILGELRRKYTATVLPAEAGIQEYQDKTHQTLVPGPDADPGPAGVMASGAEEESNLGAALSSVAASDVIRRDLDAVRKAVVEADGIVAAVDGLAKAEKAARAALETARGTSDKAGRDLQDARHRLEAAGLDHARLTREGDALAQEAEKARTAALTDLEPFGIGMISSKSLDTLFAELTGRKERWQKWREQEAVAEKRIGELTAALEKEGALLANTEGELSVRRDDFGVLSGQVESLAASRRELFGEKDPDREEKRLAKDAEQAGRAFDQTREAHGQRERELGALNERIALLKAKTGERAAELARAEGDLASRIEKAGFAGESDYVSSRVSEEERERLTAREEALNGERTELDARRRDRMEALATERAKNLTDRPAEVLREDFGACDADLKGIRGDIGKVAGSLAENEKMRDKQAERIGVLDAQKKECAPLGRPPCPHRFRRREEIQELRPGPYLRDDDGPRQPPAPEDVGPLSPDPRPPPSPWS